MKRSLESQSITVPELDNTIKVSYVMCWNLPIIGCTGNKSSCLIKLDIINGRYFVFGKINVTKNSFNSLDLGDF